MEKSLRARIVTGLSIFNADVKLHKWEIAGVCALAIVGALLYYVWAVQFRARRADNYGFGPEWDCGDPIKPSALICMKRPVKAQETR